MGEVTGAFLRFKVFEILRMKVDYERVGGFLEDRIGKFRTSEDSVNVKDGWMALGFEHVIRGASQNVGGFGTPAASGVGFHEAHKGLDGLFFVRMVEDAQVGCSGILRVDVDDLFEA